MYPRPGSLTPSEPGFLFARTQLGGNRSLGSAGILLASPPAAKMAALPGVSPVLNRFRNPLTETPFTVKLGGDSGVVDRRSHARNSF